jgi:putative ABC transport system permease protein
MIRLKNVCKEYNGVKILSNINIKFRKHEFVCILGPSGSGKSTLLNIIGGNTKTSLGAVFYGNNDINNINLDYYHNSLISYIYQSYNLIDTLNVYDNVTLGLKLTNKKVQNKIIKITLKRLGLNNYEKRNTKDLSGGEKQRVAIARTLLNNTNVILADEPTGALDSNNSLKVIKILKKISQKKLVIMVTHNEEIASKYASRIINIRDGKIISDTNPCNYNYFNKIKSTKTRLKIKDLLKLSFINIKTKRVRNILTIMAFSIGLFSLSLVLSISNGFSKELHNLETKSLFNYPLVINNESVDLDSSLNNNQKYSKNVININTNKVIKNNMDDKLINKVKKLKNLTNGIAIYKNIDTNFKMVSYVNPNNDLFKIIKGRYPKNNNEVLLLLDSNNAIDENVKSFLKLSKYNYDEVINKVIKVQNNKLIITGIVKSNNDYFAQLNGILYQDSLFNNKITSINLYPKDYKSKLEIKKKLSKYNIIDDASSVLKVTNTLIKSVSMILIIFSVISLFVSIIMIAIISYIGVLERLNEIGIEKSLGTSKRDIRRLFIIENNIIGFISSFIAIIFTYIFGLLLNNYIKNYVNLNKIVLVDIKIIIEIFILSLVLTYLAGFIPAIKASKKEITEILHNS